MRERPWILVTALMMSMGLACGARAEGPALAINHVGISTTSMERSLHFYRDLLGMEVLTQGEFDNKPIYNNIFSLKNAKGKGAMLRLGEMHIELFEFERPRGRAPDVNQSVIHPRIYHICFVVADLDKEFARLKALGVPFHYPPQDFGVARAVYGRDPDGNVIELLEWPKGKEKLGSANLGGKGATGSGDAAATSEVASAIRHRLADFVTAFNGRDLNAVLAQYDPSFFAIFGGKTMGFDEYMGTIRDALSKEKPDRMRLEVNAVRSLGNDYAAANGRVFSLLPDGTERAAPFSVIYMRVNGEWKFVYAHS